MENIHDAASSPHTFAGMTTQGALPSAVADRALPEPVAGIASDLFAPDLKEQWELYGRLPLDLSISFPLQEITVGYLASLSPGMLLHSAWPAAEDVPMSTGEVFLANVSFEPMGLRLGVRLSGFAPRPVPAAKRPSPVFESEGLEAGEPGTANALHAWKDLWLSLSVCVATVQVPLEQILQWAIGDTIPLDRAVNAPVNILLKDRIVASGNLVLVGGFYAVQLTGIAPRSRRLPPC